MWRRYALYRRATTVFHQAEYALAHNGVVVYVEGNPMWLGKSVRDLSEWGFQLCDDGPYQQRMIAAYEAKSAKRKEQ